MGVQVRSLRHWIKPGQNRPSAIMTTEFCVCVYDGDGDEPSFYQDGVRAARRPHTCCECEGIIAAGQRYHYARGKWDGDFRAYATCLACHDIRCNFFCDGYTFTMMWERIEEQVFAEGTLTGACLNQLGSVDAKQLLAERWWAWVQQR